MSALYPRSTEAEKEKQTLNADSTYEGKHLTLVFALYVVAMFVFALQHPVLEWPDAETHLTGSCQGDVAFPLKPLLDSLGQDVCSFAYHRPVEQFRFFSDQTSTTDLSSINPIWTYIFPSLLCLIALFFLVGLAGNRDAVGAPFIFAPPLAFYLSNVNVEIFGIFIILYSYFIFRTRPAWAMALACVATAIDRSHVCSVFTLFLLYFFASERRAALFPYFFLIVVALYVARIAGLFAILDLIAVLFDRISILGVTSDDVMSNAEFGSRGYAALLASAGGLYGAMSYRPVLWPMYYGVFFILLGIGWARSEAEERKVLLVAISAALCVMIILPPLSQARYFPVLIISMWSMALKGGRWFGVQPILLQVLFFCWTVVSIITANLSHIANS